MVDNGASLQKLAEWLAAWTWPMAKDQVMASAEEFGWTITSNRPGKGARWDTGMAPPGASATVLDGILADLTINTSDDVEDPAALRDVFTDQVETVSRVLGPPSRRSPGRRPSATWELSSGSELKVGAASSSCYWVLTSPKFAEIRRDLGPGA